MSQDKNRTHHIQVRNRPGFEGRPTMGTNTEVLLDGIPLKGCSFFKFEVKAGKTARITMELYAEVEIDVNSVLVESEAIATDLKLNGKTVNIYTLSSPFPTIVAEKDGDNT